MTMHAGYDDMPISAAESTRPGCKEPYCKKPVRAKQLCGTHHSYYLRHGFKLPEGKIELHGLSKTPEYPVWCGIIDRCENSKKQNFKHYGGRGIKMCAKWRKSFKAFYSDMGARPSPKYSIERIDVNGDYEPNNCKWATQSEQCLNRRMASNNTSGHVGVVWHKKSNSWRATYRSRDIGYFKNKMDAVSARMLVEATHI